ncbi:hypothetical protein HCU40_00790 [Pseudanabaena biceps]|nr:hypothetical protein [Pseudanabaena biceps]
MNNLNINHPTINPTNNRDRQVTIEFTGGHFRLRPFVESTVKVTVSYSSFSRKLQEIQRRGGKIVNVTIPQFEIGLLVDGDIAPKLIVEVIPAIATSLETEVVAENLPEESLLEISVDQSLEPLVTEQVTSDNDNVEPLVTEAIVSEDLVQHLPENPSVEEILVPEVKTPETLTEASIIINAEPSVEVKSPKSKTTSKSGSGFNKPKASTKAPRASKKPKS